MNRQFLLFIPAVALAAMAVFYWCAAGLLAEHQMNLYKSFPKWLKPAVHAASFGLYESKARSMNVTRFAALSLVVCSAWCFWAASTGWLHR